ncbi:MAG: hypothetical protein ACAI25_00195, partial [Planctomycetota bacterium]
MLRRSAFFCSLLAIALISARGEGGEPAPRPLWQALASKEITVEPRSTGGADRAELTIANVGSDGLVLDVNGALVLPVKTVGKTVAAPAHDAGLWTNPGTREKPPEEFEPTQPLGVGLVAGKGGDTTIRLARGQTAKVAVLTVCLNQDMLAPDATTPLVLAREPAPDKARAVLAAWKAEPNR